MSARTQSSVGGVASEPRPLPAGGAKGSDLMADAPPAGAVVKVCERCGEDFEPRNVATARFCGPACRTAAWKERVGYRDTVAQRPAGASRNARKPARPTAPRISYAKTVDAVADYLSGFAGLEGRLALDRAEEILEPLLTPAGRKALGR